MSHLSANWTVTSHLIVKLDFDLAAESNTKPCGWSSGNCLNWSILTLKCKKWTFFNFKLQTGLLRLLLHSKTAHTTFSKPENASKVNTNLNTMTFTMQRSVCLYTAYVCRRSHGTSCQTPPYFRMKISLSQHGRLVKVTKPTAFIK